MTINLICWFFCKISEFSNSVERQWTDLNTFSLLTVFSKSTGIWIYKNEYFLALNKIIKEKNVHQRLDKYKKH